jgi:hypothetical protein
MNIWAQKVYKIPSKSYTYVISIDIYYIIQTQRLLLLFIIYYLLLLLFIIYYLLLVLFILLLLLCENVR